MPVYSNAAIGGDQVAPSEQVHLQDTAGDLAEQGFRVFPLVPHGKTPAVEDFPNVATSDPEKARAKWAPVLGDPDERNIGIATGRGLLVLDFDCKEGQSGQASFAMLDALGLPATRTVRTASGGFHKYLRIPADLKLSNSVGKVMSNVDVRAENGYVVAPGSVTEKGAYTLAEDLPIADAPDWLIAMCEKQRVRTADATPLVDLDTPEAISRATEWLRTEAEPSFKGSGGDAAAYAAACGARDFGISEPTCLELMLDHWNDRGMPSWSPERLAVKVENAYRYALNPAGVASADAEFGALPDEALDSIEATKPKRGLTVRNISDRSGFKTCQDYVIRGLLNRGMVALMSGPSNAGKSPLALDIAATVAKGEPWQGMKVRKGYVLYISTEGWSGIGARIEAIWRTHFPEGGDVPLDYAACSIDLRTSSASAKEICAIVKEKAAHFGLPPAMVIIDTLSHALGGGDESNPEHVRALFKNCQRITNSTGAAVVLLHHPTKDAGSDYRGSSILINDTDLLIKVDVDSKKQVRTVSTPRVKEYAEIEPLHFQIRVVELGHDDEGDRITSVVVDWQDATEFGELPMTGEEADLRASYAEARGHVAAAMGADPTADFMATTKTIVAVLTTERPGARVLSERSAGRLLAEWSGRNLAKKAKHGQYLMAVLPSCQGSASNLPA